MQLSSVSLNASKKTRGLPCLSPSKMEDSRFPFLISAPTLRVPYSVAGSINAYRAMRGILVAILNHNREEERQIRSVAISGLGTGVGQIPHHEAARQMRKAYNQVIGGEWRKVVHSALARLKGGAQRSIMRPSMPARNTVCGDGPNSTSEGLSRRKRQRQNPSSAQAVRSFSAPYQTPASSGARKREPTGDA